MYTSSSNLASTTKDVLLNGEFILVTEGNTLVIDENVKLAENTVIVLDDNATVENKTDKDVVAAYVTNSDEIDSIEDLDKLELKTITVKPNEKATAKKEEVKDPETPVSKDEPKEEIEVPNTFDGITTYVVIAIISVIGLVVTATKLRKRFN